MGDGNHKPDKTESNKCWQIIWKQPYLIRLAFSASIGGLIFGYATGGFYNFLPYIRNELSDTEVLVTQMGHVSLVLAGAAIVGTMKDNIERKKAILATDICFFFGIIALALAQDFEEILFERLCMGMVVGAVSVTAPLYISEASPASIRGALVSTFFLLIAAGQSLSYIMCQASTTKTSGTWYLMLGLVGILALVQFALTLSLPDSPRDLYIKNRKDEAVEVLRKMYPHNVDKEVEAIRLSLEVEIAEEGYNDEDGNLTKVWKALSNVAVRRGLIAGIGCQVAQQFVGINIVMYYSPAIVQLAGYTSNKMTPTLSLVASSLTAVGCIVSMSLVDRYGRRRLLLTSIFGIIVGLGLLFGVFYGAAIHFPCFGRLETTHFRDNSVSNVTAPDAPLRNCMTCLRVSSDCFYAHGGNSLHPEGSGFLGENRGLMALVGLGLYIVSYSSGMGTIPWIINLELYPLRHRSVCGMMAALAYWVSNLIVIPLMFPLTVAFGFANTFLVFCLVSCALALFIYLVVPETKGLPLEEVEKMLLEKIQDFECGSGTVGAPQVLDEKLT